VETIPVDSSYLHVNFYIGYCLQEEIGFWELACCLEAADEKKLITGKFPTVGSK